MSRSQRNITYHHQKNAKIKARLSCRRSNFVKIIREPSATRNAMFKVIRSNTEIAIIPPRIVQLRSNLVDCVDPTSPNLWTRRLSQHYTFVLEFGYLAAFSNAGGSNWVMLKTTLKFRTFWPPPVKIRRGVGEIYIQIIVETFLYLRSNLRYTFDGHPLSGCWAR